MATETGSDGRGSWRIADMWAIAALLLPLGVVTVDLAQQYWIGGENGQSPIVLAAGVYAYWNRRDLFDWQVDRTASIVGWCLVAVGLIALAVGRSVLFLQLEALCIPIMAAGVTLLWGGRKAWRALWKMNLVLFAVLPLPGSLADALLVPMKQFVSSAVVWLLAAAHYPVALNGVIISIGFYQLQVADACSGLWSLVSLISAGLLYEFFVGSSRPAVLVAFLALIPVIALLTNFLRVLSLVLTVHMLGSQAEQQLHDIAAYLEVGLSLALFALAHTALEHLLGTSSRRAAA